MNYIYYIDGEKYYANEICEISLENISSPNENIPAYEVLNYGHKEWCEK